MLVPADRAQGHHPAPGKGLPVSGTKAPDVYEREPWGTNATSALHWAFNLIERVPYPANAIAQMRTKSRPRGELTPLELRGQAALIRKVVEELGDPLARSYLVAYYLPKPVVRRVPGGGTECVDLYADLRERPIHDVAWWLMGQSGTGMKRFRGYQEIVAQHCLGIRNIQRLERLLKTRYETAIKQNGECQKVLLDLRGRATTMMQGRLEELGYV
jgi:hypothetical protein